MILAHPSEEKLRILLDHPTAIEYDVGLLPSSVSTGRILSLDDIEKTGARILSSATQIFTIQKQASPHKSVREYLNIRQTYAFASDRGQTGKIEMCGIMARRISF